MHLKFNIYYNYVMKVLNVKMGSKTPHFHQKKNKKTIS